MSPDRADRARSAVRATIDFLALRDQGSPFLCRAERYLLQHRADGSRCASCGAAYPCSLVRIAEAAQALAVSRRSRAARQAVSRSARTDTAGAA